MAVSIVILDAKATNPGDLSWKEFENYGALTVYENTNQEELISRGQNASIIVTNKLKIGKKEIEQLPSLGLICQLATGYDNIDIKAAREKNIPVCNAVGYGSKAVAQHAIALLLAATNRIETHNSFVQSGGWSKSTWSHSLTPLVELSGLNMGIYGYGKIGQQVGIIAKSLGMKILATTRSPEKYGTDDVEFVGLKELFRRCDVISLHAPLSTSNKQLVDRSLLQLMKSNGILINTGRGGLIHELDLRDHLLNHPSQTAALDVLSQEPPPSDHPLFGLDNCIITSHNAWAAKAARARLISIVAGNIEAFLAGAPENVVN